MSSDEGGVARTMSSSRIRRWRSSAGAFRTGAASFEALRIGAVAAGRDDFTAVFTVFTAFFFGVRAFRTAGFATVFATLLVTFFETFFATFFAVAAGRTVFRARPRGAAFLAAFRAPAGRLADELLDALALERPVRLARFRPAAAADRRAGDFVAARAAFRLAIALILSEHVNPNLDPGLRRRIGPRTTEPEPGTWQRGTRNPLITLTVTG
jgi:hypothetical protein